MLREKAISVLCVNCDADFRSLLRERVPSLQLFALKPTQITEELRALVDYVVYECPPGLTDPSQELTRLRQNFSVPIVLTTKQVRMDLVRLAMQHKFEDLICLPSELEHLMRRLRIFATTRDQSQQRPYLQPDTRTAKALDLVKKQYREKITLQQASRLCHMSISTFNRTFKREHGTTFAKYLGRHRVRCSEELLLKTNLPIQTIACQVGIDTPSYFIKVFKSYHSGTTPQDFRESERQRLQRSA